VQEGGTTGFAVDYDLDGTSAPLPKPLRFTLNKGNNNPSILVLFFTFQGTGGGTYTTVVKGSQGGDTSTYTIAQFGNQASNAIAYTFDII
jgi:hypothetical protein